MSTTYINIYQIGAAYMQHSYIHKEKREIFYNL